MGDANLIEAINALTGQIKDMRSELKTLNSTINTLAENQNNLRYENIKLKRDNMEIRENLKRRTDEFRQFVRGTRSKQVMLSGKLATETSNEGTMEQRILKVFKEDLGVQVVEEDLEEMRKFVEKPDYINVLITFKTENARNMIFKSKNKLKGTKLFINEYYTKDVYEDRKFLLKEKIRLEEKKIASFLKYDKLVIDGKPYTKEELMAKTDTTDGESWESQSEEELNTTIKENPKIKKRKIGRGATGNQSMRRYLTVNRPGPPEDVVVTNGIPCAGGSASA